jgi:hypothetical protein
MKKNEMEKLLKQQDSGGLFATYLSQREPRTIGQTDKQQVVTDYSVMLSRGATLKVSVFKPINAAGSPGMIAGLKFGDRVLCTGFVVGLKDGYMNASAESVEVIEQ